VGEGGPIGCIEFVIHAFPSPRQELTLKTHRLYPLSTRFLGMLTLSVMKRRPEIVVQTIATVNDCWWRFAAGGSMVGAFSCSISESSVVPALAVGFRQVFRGAAMMVPVVRMSTGFETPTVWPLGVRAL
jgi:hypothetical protein